jgi:hypothetical protein
MLSGTQSCPRDKSCHRQARPRAAVAVARNSFAISTDLELRLRPRPRVQTGSLPTRQFVVVPEALERARNAGLLAEDANQLLSLAPPHLPDEFLARYVTVFERVSLAIGLSVAGAFLVAGAEVMLRTDLSSPGPTSPPWDGVRSVGETGSGMLADLEMSISTERDDLRIRTTWAKDVLTALRRAREAGILARDMDLLMSRGGALLPRDVYERPVKVMERIRLHAVLATAEVLLVNGAEVWMRSYPAACLQTRVHPI